MRRLLLVAAPLWLACGLREPGVTVEVSLDVRGAATTSSGAPVDLARLSLRAVELVECDSVARRLLRALAPVAFAHGGRPDGSNPRRATVEAAVELRASHRELVARLEPPPGAWCGLVLTLGPSPSPAAWGGTTLLVDVGGASPRRYLDASTVDVRLALPRFTLGGPGLAQLLVSLDASAPLASLDPASPDPRRDLRDLLLAAFTAVPWSPP